MPLLHLRVQSTELTRHVSQITAGDGIAVKANGLPVSRVFDGHETVLPDYEHYTQEDVSDELRFPRYPMLARKGCAYDMKSHSISGNIGALLRDCEALW